MSVSPEQVTGSGTQAVFNPSVQGVVERSFQMYARRTLLRWEGGSATYAETWTRVLALARWFRATSGDGDRIAILLPNCREYVEAILGCALAGRVRVPLNMRDSTADQAFKIAHSGSRTVIGSPEALESLQAVMAGDLPQALVVGSDASQVSQTGAMRYADVVAAPGSGALARTDPLTPFRFSYTGGTTGTPKAVVTDHRRELAMVRNLLMDQVVSPGLDSVFVAATPFSHASGSFVLPTLIAGGSLAWTPGFEPDRLVDPSWLRAPVRVETFVVPTALADLVDTAGPDPTSSFATIVYGGAPCSAELQSAAARAFPRALVQVYGQAEAPMTICVLTKDDHEDMAAVGNTVGRPFRYVDVGFMTADGSWAEPGSPGEIVVRADHVMAGYWNDAEATRGSLDENGALRTSDVGYADDNGYVHIVDRVRDLIISGGYNVYPGDLERRMDGVEGVRQLAAFGVSHPRWGEAVVLAVELGGGASPTAVQSALEARGHSALASYERPKEIVFVEQMPVTALGKIARRDLRDAHADLFSREVP